MAHQTLDQQDSIRALANYLEINYSEAVNLVSDQIYAVETETAAYNSASENIKNNLWSFQHSFLSQFSPTISSISVEQWVSMSSNLCEDFNPLVLALIKAESDLSQVVESAIEADGLGHFLDSYDGSCVYSVDVCTCNLDTTYVIYKMY